VVMAALAVSANPVRCRDVRLQEVFDPERHASAEGGHAGALMTHIHVRG